MSGPVATTHACRPWPPAAKARATDAVTVPVWSVAAWTMTAGTVGTGTRPTRDLKASATIVRESLAGWTVLPHDVLPLDRDLGDAQPQTVRPQQQLDVECEPVGLDQAEEEAGDRRTEGLESALGVSQAKAGAGRDHPVEHIAHQAAQDVSGLDHRIGERPRPHGDVVVDQGVEQ